MRRPMHVPAAREEIQKSRTPSRDHHLSVCLGHQVQGKRGIALDRAVGVEAGEQVLRGVIHRTLGQPRWEVEENFINSWFSVPSGKWIW